MKTEQIAGRIWRAVWQSGAMVVLACVIGLLVNEGRPDGLALVADWSPEVRLTTDEGDSMIVSLEEAERLCLDKKAVFLDARTPEEYARGHISTRPPTVCLCLAEGIQKLPEGSVPQRPGVKAST